MNDEKLKPCLDKVYDALLRFRAIVNGEECECDEYNGYTCTVHRDRVLATDAIEAWNRRAKC